MSNGERVLRGPPAFERDVDAVANRIAAAEHALLSRLPYHSPTGLLKDLIVFFHERQPEEETANFPDHAGVIADLQKSFHADLERIATRNNLGTSTAAALGILRVLARRTGSSPQRPGKRPPGPTRGQANQPQSGAVHAVAAEQQPGSKQHEPSPFQTLSRRQLDMAHGAVEDAIQLSELVQTTGLEGMVQPPGSIRPPAFPPILEQMAEVFSRNPDLLRILKLLGRLSDLDSERRSQGAHPPSGELYDIELGADLDRVVPSDLSLLSHPLGRLEFFRRYSERSLMQYKRRPQPDGRGPICVCIDRSPSMAGEKSILARSLALFCIKKAWAQRRDAIVVLFDVKTSTYRFPWKNASMDELRRFLSSSLGGGTRYRVGFQACKRRIDEHMRKKGDILLIGDGEEAPSQADRKWLKKFDTWMEDTGTRLFTVHIGKAQLPLAKLLKKMSDETLMMERLPKNSLNKIAGLVSDRFGAIFAGGTRVPPKSGAPSR